jgi:hypothetical protein
MSDKIQKLFMGRNGFQLNFGFDFQKATDETQRTVVGFATLDNLDQTGDIVLAKASEEAFRTFRGNIREQHNKTSAVGRMVAFEPAEYTNHATGEVYKGIRVAVRISEGAEDTWKKCKDGTYSGFSIQGAVLASEPYFDKASGQTVKIISKYRLTELSLVDNPANELANFETVYKALDGEDLEKSFDTQNLFYCPVDNVAAKDSKDSYPCGACGENMARIGTVSENEDMKEKLTKVLSELEINTEGVIPTMSKEIEKNADGTEEVDATKVEAPEVEADAAVDTAADTDTKEDESDVTATLAALQTQLADVSAKVEELVTTKANNLKDIEEKLEKLIEDNTSLSKKLEEKNTEFSELKKSLESTGERVEAIASATAMRTSEDFVEEVEKDNAADDGWGGLFSGQYYNNKTSD